MIMMYTSTYYILAEVREGSSKIYGSLTQTDVAEALVAR